MTDNNTRSTRPAYVITGPTSGIGYRTALELAARGTVVLVGRDKGKLAHVEAQIEALPGGAAISVVGDLSDVTSMRRAAAEIVALGLPIAGVLNNAGVMLGEPRKSAQGWDLVYATNHVGPFAFTEALIPHLPDGTNVTFIVSAVEDPERKPAVNAGYRGGRYISAEASARGEWMPGGAKTYINNSYATSKQGGLAAVFSLARQYPRLRFRAIEPGVNPSSNLGNDSHPRLAAIGKVLAPALVVFPYFSTPKRAGRMIARVVTDTSDATGIYYDENGKPMQASKQVRDPAFADRVVAETRELLATMPNA